MRTISVYGSPHCRGWCSLEQAQQLPGVAGAATPQGDGTLTVEPAASLCAVAAEAGAGLVIVNRDATPYDRRYGTTVTGHLPAFTSRTASEPTNRCPACAEAPTTIASARTSLAMRLIS